MPTTPEIKYTMGLPGSRIDGSRLLRAYCVACGQPMRVQNATQYAQCTDCRPGGQPARRSDQATTAAIRYHGGQFNQGEW